MENKNTNEAELIIKRVDEKISELYKRLDLVLLNVPEASGETTEPSSSKLVESLIGIETRLGKLLEIIRL